MTRKQMSIDAETMKGLLGQEEDSLKPLVQAVVQEVLEAEMSEVLPEALWQEGMCTLCVMP